MFYYLSRIFMLWFGAGYPAYRTYKATKHKNIQEHNKWLTYWIVYAAFICLEPFLDILAYIVPFYYVIKIAFLYWLIVIEGASIVYHLIIHPILGSREKEIDKRFNRIRTEHLDGLIKMAQDLVTRVVSLVNSAIANNKPKQPLGGNNNQPLKHPVTIDLTAGKIGVTTGQKDL